MSRKNTRITLDELLEREGYTDAADMAADLQDEPGIPALCDEGCLVEPDGECPHGCPSLYRAIGVI